VIALLRKDLLILRRSRLLLALLIVYPIAISLLIGFAISRAPARPNVALLDETPPGQTVTVGGRTVEVSSYADGLVGGVHEIPVQSRAAAVEAVESGRAVAAVVIPANVVAKIGSVGGPTQLEVLYNGNALEQSIVASKIEAAVARANVEFSRQIQSAAAKASNQLVSGGSGGVLGAPADMIGLGEIPPVIERQLRTLPPGSERHELERVLAFARFAHASVGETGHVLATIGQPLTVHNVLISGRRTPLDTFAVAVAVAISLMFVSVLQAAGSLALEREDNALARLLRGLVSPAELIVEKSVLAAGAAFAVAFVMLAAISAFVPISWGRVGEWVLALAVGALAFAAVGVAIGANAREVRAATLLAFIVTLPLALLALVPAGAVSGALGTVISVISFVFPFRATLDALDNAINGASPALAPSLAHLVLLALVFGALARLGLRRGRAA
jgi:ABC-2 type transport system permease protein